MPAKRRYYGRRKKSHRKSGSTLRILPTVLAAEDSGLIFATGEAVSSGKWESFGSNMKSKFDLKDLIVDQAAAKLIRLVAGTGFSVKAGKTRVSLF